MLGRGFAHGIDSRALLRQVGQGRRRQVRPRGARLRQGNEGSRFYHQGDCQRELLSQGHPENAARRAVAGADERRPPAWLDEPRVVCWRTSSNRASHFDAPPTEVLGVQLPACGQAHFESRERLPRLVEQPTGNAHARGLGTVDVTAVRAERDAADSATERGGPTGGHRVHINDHPRTIL